MLFLGFLQWVFDSFEVHLCRSTFDCKYAVKSTDKFWARCHEHKATVRQKSLHDIFQQTMYTSELVYMRVCIASACLLLLRSNHPVCTAIVPICVCVHVWCMCVCESVYAENVCVYVCSCSFYCHVLTGRPGAMELSQPCHHQPYQRTEWGCNLVAVRGPGLFCRIRWVSGLVWLAMSELEESSNAGV